MKKLKNLAVAIAVATSCMALPGVCKNMDLSRIAIAEDEFDDGYDKRAETLQICIDSIDYNIDNRIKDKNCNTEDYGDAMLVIEDMLEVAGQINPDEKTKLEMKYNKALMGK